MKPEELTATPSWLIIKIHNHDEFGESMKNEPCLPTRDEINELAAYLPRLYAPGFDPELSWEGGQKDEKGIIHLPYPIYDKLVEEFIRVASRECWLDDGYNPEGAYALLNDDAAIRSASLSQVKSMLTFIVRGERFSDGHWGEMIRKGFVRKVLERLARFGESK